MASPLGTDGRHPSQAGCKYFQCQGTEAIILSQNNPKKSWSHPCVNEYKEDAYPCIWFNSFSTWNGLASNRNLLATIKNNYCYVRPVNRILLTLHGIQEKTLTICLKGSSHFRCHLHNTCGRSICCSGNLKCEARILFQCMFLHLLATRVPSTLFSSEDKASCCRISHACLVATRSRNGEAAQSSRLGFKLSSPCNAAGEVSMDSIAHVDPTWCPALSRRWMTFHIFCLETWSVKWSFLVLITCICATLGSWQPFVCRKKSFCDPDSFRGADGILALALVYWMRKVHPHLMLLVTFLVFFPALACSSAALVAPKNFSSL